MKQEIFAKFSYDDGLDFAFYIKGPKITKDQVRECVQKYFPEKLIKKIWDSEEWEDCDDEDLNAYGNEGDEYPTVFGSYGPLSFSTEIMNVFNA